MRNLNGSGVNIMASPRAEPLIVCVHLDVLVCSSNEPQLPARVLDNSSVPTTQRVVLIHGKPTVFVMYPFAKMLLELLADCGCLVEVFSAWGPAVAQAVARAFQLVDAPSSNAKTVGSRQLVSLDVPPPTSPWTLRSLRKQPHEFHRVVIVDHEHAVRHAWHPQLRDQCIGVSHAALLHRTRAQLNRLVSRRVRADPGDHLGASLNLTDEDDDAVVLDAASGCVSVLRQAIHSLALLPALQRLMRLFELWSSSVGALSVQNCCRHISTGLFLGRTFTLESTRMHHDVSTNSVSVDHSSDVLDAVLLVEAHGGVLVQTEGGVTNSCGSRSADYIISESRGERETDDDDNDLSAPPSDERDQERRKEAWVVDPLWIRACVAAWCPCLPRDASASFLEADLDDRDGVAWFIVAHLMILFAPPISAAPFPVDLLRSVLEKSGISTMPLEESDFLTAVEDCLVLEYDDEHRGSPDDEVPPTKTLKGFRSRFPRFLYVSNIERAISTTLASSTAPVLSSAYCSQLAAEISKLLERPQSRDATTQCWLVHHASVGCQSDALEPSGLLKPNVVLSLQDVSKALQAKQVVVPPPVALPSSAAHAAMMAAAPQRISLESVVSSRPSNVSTAQPPSKQAPASENAVVADPAKIPLTAGVAGTSLTEPRFAFMLPNKYFAVRGRLLREGVTCTLPLFAYGATIASSTNQKSLKDLVDCPPVLLDSTKLDVIDQGKVIRIRFAEPRDAGRFCDQVTVGLRLRKNMKAVVLPEGLTLVMSDTPPSEMLSIDGTANAAKRSSDERGGGRRERSRSDSPNKRRRVETTRSVSTHNNSPCLTTYVAPATTTVPPPPAQTHAARPPGFQPIPPAATDVIHAFTAMCTVEENNVIAGIGAKHEELCRNPDVFVDFAFTRLADFPTQQRCLLNAVSKVKQLRGIS